MRTSRKQDILTGFLKRFLPLLGVTLLAAWLVYWHEHDDHPDRLRTAQEGVVAVAADTSRSKLAWHVEDALYLASVTSTLLQSSTLTVEDAMEELEAIYLDLARYRPEYCQVRFLDRAGIERIRAEQDDGPPWLVGANQLQDKSGRYYFTKGMKAGTGVYLSRFDLNVEHGKVERPFVPMPRLAARVVAG
ncbi:MAG: hypothetical protein ACLFOY_17325 [Desulfatibacillaceae bacterium]